MKRTQRHNQSTEPKNRNEPSRRNRHKPNHPNHPNRSNRTGKKKVHDQTNLLHSLQDDGANDDSDDNNGNDYKKNDDNNNDDNEREFNGNKINEDKTNNNNNNDNKDDNDNDSSLAAVSMPGRTAPFGTTSKLAFKADSMLPFSSLNDLTTTYRIVRTQS